MITFVFLVVVHSIQISNGRVFESLLFVMTTPGNRSSSCTSTKIEVVPTRRYLSSLNTGVTLGKYQYWNLLPNRMILDPTEFSPHLRAWFSGFHTVHDTDSPICSPVAQLPER
jgi:hypothetical protein